LEISTFKSIISKSTIYLYCVSFRSENNFDYFTNEGKIELDTKRKNKAKEKGSSPIKLINKIRSKFRLEGFVNK
jgi:hypothetical protein